ncbi:hypothetical protein Henu3_gp95 [Mycobacterium phage Henu3]|uniref:Uncharacterized protein n=1 Tax=Mycobacterium phage Henu3 TaxID=2492961 RepID=A0A410T7Q9_9CAUD|nr:hypothetical protein I5G68_gp79 [Mycobacterium phage Henu3]QAU05031.1 hypothetical protein Henu3_gp95 [Mycobacterium phage Henu3]
MSTDPRSRADVAVGAGHDALRRRDTIAGRAGNLRRLLMVALKQPALADEPASVVAAKLCRRVLRCDLLARLAAPGLAAAGSAALGARPATRTALAAEPFLGAALHQIGDLPLGQQIAVVVAGHRVVVVEPVVDVARRRVAVAHRHRDALAVIVAAHIRCVRRSLGGRLGAVQARRAALPHGQHAGRQHAAESARIRRCVPGPAHALTLGVVVDRAPGLVEHPARRRADDRRAGIALQHSPTTGLRQALPRRQLGRLGQEQALAGDPAHRPNHVLAVPLRRHLARRDDERLDQLGIGVGDELQPLGGAQLTHTRHQSAASVTGLDRQLLQRALKLRNGLRHRYQPVTRRRSAEPRSAAVPRRAAGAAAATADPPAT